MEPIEDDTEFLASLEERILKAVEMVTVLRKENEGLREKLESALSDRDAAQHGVSEVRMEIAVLRKEIDSLKAERKQVRSRIEKLLGQMDLLSAG
jgi:FtsZ-binding cell division protein ZapB